MIYNFCFNSLEKTMSTNTFCGFPKRFTSSTDEIDEPNNAFFLMQELLKDTDGHLEVNPKGYDGEFSLQPPQQGSVEFAGQSIRLPVASKQIGGCPNALVPYIQELLDINGHHDLLVVLDHTDSFDFELLTQSELKARLEYPIGEYRANIDHWATDGIPIHHPNIPYTYIWMSLGASKLFTPGCESNFPVDSVCYRSCYGTEA